MNCLSLNHGNRKSNAQKDSFSAVHLHCKIPVLDEELSTILHFVIE